MTQRIAVKHGRKGVDGQLKLWVMLGTDGDEPEFGDWLTPAQARALAKRLAAADKADGK